MPNLDGMGPRGEGPKTGRAMGNCDGSSNQMPQGRGFGRGRGFRRGFGRGPVSNQATTPSNEAKS